MTYHVPVLLNEVLQFLDLQPGHICIDCTMGGAGHGLEITKRIIPDGLYVGIDKDDDAICVAKSRLKAYEENILLVRDDFSNIKTIVERLGIKTVNGVLLDLGVSSHQLDEGGRGFTYQQDVPLDMRMNRQQEKTSKDLVNELSKEELGDIIHKYGEERWAKRIATYIVKERENRPINRTDELVEVIKKAIPAKYRREGPHPARRTFQALRIALNDELNALDSGLKDVIEILSQDGIICVISYHSLEDRIVKRIFKEYSDDCHCPPDFPVCVCNGKAILEVLTKKPLVPSDGEIKNNPRARSGRLRVARKL